MSNPVIIRPMRNVLAASALVIATGVLSGCSSLGGSAFTDPTVTGATGRAAGANMGQAMPQPINVQPSSSAKYLPPADVGGMARGPLVTNGIATPVQTAGVASQDLPKLNSSPVVGSTQAMPAQLTVASNETAPASIPQAVKAAPQLKTVPATGYSHVIESGESLYAIARRYKVTTDSIVLANNLESPDKIRVGQKIVIPGVKTAPAAVDPVQTASVAKQPVQPKVHNRTPVKSAAPTQTASVQKTPVATPIQQQRTTSNSNGKFRWPVSGKVIADFAMSKGTGINIAVPEGTAVRAAETGSVIYVGSAVEGYGNLILVKHDSGYVSAYAHLSQITVSKGDKVMRGDAIGLSGKTGSVSQPQLHFELRKGATPVDPVSLLAS